MFNTFFKKKEYISKKGSTVKSSHHFDGFNTVNTTKIIGKSPTITLEHGLTLVQIKKELRKRKMFKDMDIIMTDIG